MRGRDEGVLFLTVVARREVRRGGKKQVEPCVFPEDISEIVNLLCDQKGNISAGAFASEGVTLFVKHELTGSLQSPQGGPDPSLLHSL